MTYEWYQKINGNVKCGKLLKKILKLKKKSQILKKFKNFEKIHKFKKKSQILKKITNFKKIQ